MSDGNRVGVGFTRSMVLSPLWRGPDNIHGFILHRQSYRQGRATAQAPTVSAVSGVRITTLMIRACSLTTIACGRWSLVTMALFLSNYAPGAMPKQQPDEV